MSRNAILMPMLALVLLTIVVGLVTLQRRVGEMRAKRIHPQQVATAAQMAARLTNVGAADNFRNLFEMPILFYAAVLTIYATALTSPFYVVLGWLYVALRVLHTLIHATYNKVMHRFYAFGTSFIVLAVIWVAIAWDVAVVGRG